MGVFAKGKRRVLCPEIVNYGTAQLLREYARYPAWLPFPFNVQHGWYARTEPRPSDLRKHTPLMLVYTKRHKDAWERASETPCAVCGAPFVHYRRMKRICQTGEAAGTIAFPEHSGTNVLAQFDRDKYCRDLLSLPSKFHPIRVCLHHDDIRRGGDRIYKEYGIPVLSAGPRHDPEFVDRFYDILRAARFTTSNSASTVTLYSVEMGIPFFVYGDRPDLYDPRTNEIKGSREKEAARNLFVFADLENVCISPEQAEFVDRETGMNDCLSPTELRRLCLKLLVLRWLPRVSIRALRRVRKTITSRVNLRPNL